MLVFCIPVLLAVALAGCGPQGEGLESRREHKDSAGVSKVMVTVDRGGVPFCLLSRKKAPGRGKHDRLELLGGQHKTNETPSTAVIRELAEEEKTGLLSAMVSPTQVVERVVVSGEEHHIFRLAISHEEYLRLIADPAESLGFEIVPVSSLGERRTRERLTKKTRQILDALRRES